MAERSQGLRLPGTPPVEMQCAGTCDAFFHQMRGMQRGAKQTDTPALWSFPISGEGDSQQVKKISSLCVCGGGTLKQGGKGEGLGVGGGCGFREDGWGSRHLGKEVCRLRGQLAWRDRGKGGDDVRRGGWIA